MELTLGQADWRKSSYSGGTGNCVEVAGNLPGAVAVRDSQDPAGPALILAPAAWRALTRKVQNGELDLAATVMRLRKHRDAQALSGARALPQVNCSPCCGGMQPRLAGCGCDFFY